MAELAAQRLDAAGLVDRRADDREIEPVLGADVAEHHLAEMERDVERHDGRAGGGPVHVEARDAVQRFEGRRQRPAAQRVGVGALDVEHREQTIAEKLEHVAAIGVHRPHHALEIIVERGDDLVLGRPVAERRKAL